MAVLRISANANLFHTTRTIVSMIHKHKGAEIQAIGRPAFRHAVKAIADAKVVLQKEAIHIDSRSRVIRPGMDGNEKAGTRFIVWVIG